MEQTNLNKALAQQWKSVISQDFNNGLKKEQRVKLRLWATYIERVVSPKSANYHELIKILASINTVGKIFPPFDKAPNDRQHGGQFLENLGKKLRNLGVFRAQETSEGQTEPLSVDELNLLQKIVDPNGAREVATKQRELKQGPDGKIKTTKLQLTRIKTIPATQSRSEHKKTSTKTITATTRTGSSRRIIPSVPLISSDTPSHRAMLAKNLESELAQDINVYFGGNDDVRRYCEKQMCNFQTIFKVDQLRFDALKVLQVMIRTHCFAAPFNLSIKRRHNRKELTDHLQKLDLPAVMAKEIRAAYMVNQTIETKFDEELPFNSDIDRSMNAYLIKRFDLLPRLEDGLNRIRDLVVTGLPPIPGAWEDFLRSCKGTPVLMSAKVRLVQEICESLRLGTEYDLLGDEDPESWSNDRERYIKVRELAQNFNPNSFDDFLYDKLKTYDTKDLFNIEHLKKRVSFGPPIELPPEDLYEPRDSTFTAQPSSSESRSGSATLQGPPPSVEDYPDLRNINSANSDTSFRLHLRPDDDEPSTEVKVDPKAIFKQVDRDIGYVIKDILKMNEDDLPKKFLRFLKKAKENVSRSTTNLAD